MPIFLARGLARGLEWATIATMGLQVLVVLAGVVSRYVINRPIAGSDEIATLVLVWLVTLYSRLRVT